MYELSDKLRLEVATEEPLNKLADNDSFTPGGIQGSWVANNGTAGVGNVGQFGSPDYANGYYAQRSAAGSFYAYTGTRYALNGGDYVSAGTSVAPNGADPAEAAQFRIVLFWYDASNVAISSVSSAYVDRVYGGDGTPAGSYQLFTRLELLNAVAPSNAVSVRMAIETNNTRVGYGFYFNANVLVSNVLQEFVQDTSFVGTAPTTDTNRIANPSGEQGVTSWQEANSNMNFITRAGYVAPVVNAGYGLTYSTAWNAAAPAKTELIMLNNAAGQAQIASNTTACLAGQWVSGSILAVGKNSPAVYAFVFWQFYDSAGTLLRTDFGTGVKLNPTTPQFVNGPAVQAPTNCASVRMVVRNNPTNSTTIGSPVQYSWLMFKQAFMRVDNTAPSVRPMGLPYKWRNILGSSHSINIEREELDVGTMTATIYDPVLDPARYTSLRRGYKVRLQALVEGAWTNVFVGNVHNVSTEYFKEGKPRITLTATDAVAVLANTRYVNGVSSLKDLSGLVPATVKWAYNGAANSTGNPTIVYNNDNGSFLDIAVVARDTVRGYAYVDRDGTFQMWDTLTDLRQTVFSDGPDENIPEYVAYTALDSGYSMDELVNSVTVKRLEVKEGKTEEVTYGPFEDSASVATYGASGLTVTVAHTALTPAQVAAAVTKTTPVVTAKKTAFMVKDDRTFRQAAIMELYQLVRVKNAQANLNALYRLASLNHEIRVTPDGAEWETTVTFKSTGAQAAYTEVKSPSKPTKPDPYLAYAEVTANSGNFTTATIEFVNVSAITSVGTSVLVTGQIRSLVSTVAGDIVSVQLYRGGSKVQEMNVHLGPASAGAQGVQISAVVPGTGNSDVYSLRAVRASGTGTVAANANPAYPLFILVQRLG